MSDNLKVAKECGAVELGDQSYYTGLEWKDCQRLVFSGDALEAYTSRILASQQAAHEAEIAKLKDDEFSESKDWKESDISGRIDWLMSRVKSCREDIALLTEQQAECEQRGAVNGLKKFRSDYRLDKIYPSEFLNEAIDRAEAELRATSKKAG